MKYLKLYLPAALLLLTLFSCKTKAQKAESQKDQNMKTNTTELQRLKKAFNDKTESQDSLKAKAKKLGIPYRVENEHGIMQLVGFDGKGKPIYRTTMNGSPVKSISPRDEK